MSSSSRKYDLRKSLKLIVVNGESDEFLGDDGDEVEVSQRKASPISINQYVINNVAKQVADIIEEKDYKPLMIHDFVDRKEKIAIPCIEKDIFLDPDTSAKRAGRMDKKTAARVKQTRETCNLCPLKRECLAVSFTSPRFTRMSKTELTLPSPHYRSDTYVVMVLSEFLMYGGYTPQERALIFEKTCEILGERLHKQGKSYMSGGKVIKPGDKAPKIKSKQALPEENKIPALSLAFDSSTSIEEDMKQDGGKPVATISPEDEKVVEIRKVAVFIKPRKTKRRRR